MSAAEICKGAKKEKYPRPIQAGNASSSLPSPLLRPLHEQRALDQQLGDDVGVEVRGGAAILSNVWEVECAWKENLGYMKSPYSPLPAKLTISFPIE